MKKQNILKGLLALSAFASVPLFSTTVAMADTNFDSQYQANAAQEASLLQTAEASSVTSSYISSISSTVQNINTQIPNLYGAEQFLSNTLANIPQIGVPEPQQWQNQVNQLNKKRNNLLHQSQLAWKNVNKFFHSRNKKQYWDARAVWSRIGVQVADVNKQLANLRGEENTWKSAFNKGAYNNGLTSLQESILKLQTTAIYYTKEWISLEQNGQSSTTGNPTLSVPSISASVNNGINYISVSNAEYGATVYLYNASNGSLVSTAAANQYGNVTFSNVQAGSYYVVQELNGSQSGESNVVSVSNNYTLTAPSIYAGLSNGIYTITVTNAEYGATVDLYNAANGALVTSATADQYGNTTFSSVQAGNYYVIEYLNGAQSPSSNTIYIS